MTPARPLFFYGTLRHRPLLDLVLGTAAERVALQPARLPDHAARWVAGECYPMIRAETGAMAEGVLAQGLMPEDIDRLDFYEGGHLYALRPVTVATDSGPVAARVYFPDHAPWQDGGPFELADWEARWGAITLHSAAEFMAGYGRLSAAEMSDRFPRQRMRGWSRVIAARTAPVAGLRTGPGRAAVVPGRRMRRHDGFFALDELVLSHPRFDGGRVSVRREVLVGFDAALVLPYDPVRDRVALLEQFRAGAWARGEAQPWLLEPVAGLLDPGESPEDCARREALEETGLTLGPLVPVPGGYPSPGASSEHFHNFVGIARLDTETTEARGIAAEGEDIRTHILPLDAALALTESGEINVLPLILLLLWTAANRSRLGELA